MDIDLSQLSGPVLPLAVATTAATDDTPFGFAEEQANAIITNLNKVIANQNAIIDAMVAAGWLTIAAGE